MKPQLISKNSSQSKSITDLPSALNQIFKPGPKSPTRTFHQSCADLHSVSLSSCSDDESSPSPKKPSKTYETIHSIIPERPPRLSQYFRTLTQDHPSEFLRSKMKQSISLNNLHDEGSLGLVSHFVIFFLCK